MLPLYLAKQTLMHLSGHLVTFLTVEFLSIGPLTKLQLTRNTTAYFFGPLCRRYLRCDCYVMHNIDNVGMHRSRQLPAFTVSIRYDTIRLSTRVLGTALPAAASSKNCM